MTIIKSPLTYAVIGYTELAVGRLSQEAMIDGHLIEGSALSQALGWVVLFISLAPVVGAGLALWCLAHRSRVWESLLAIALAAPVIALWLGGIRRAGLAD